jgi:hypothetical protein
MLMCNNNVNRSQLLKYADVARAVSVLTLVLILALAECMTAVGQSPLPTDQTNEIRQEPVPADQSKDHTPISATQKDQETDKNKTEKRGSLVIAPIPISSPAFGSGLLLITGYVFKLNENDKTSPPSWLGGAGAFTNNGTRALVLGSRLYFKENKYQTTMAVGKGRANLDFFGIGRIPGRAPISVPLSMDGTIFFGELMRKTARNMFIGPRFQYRKIGARIDGLAPPGGFEVPEIDIRSNSVALGFHVQRDLRDSTFYATKGNLFDFTADFFDQAWGSRREYQVYKVAYNGFHKVASRQILAYRAMACSANGSVPFYDLCLFGFNNDLRGYTTGEFQNRRMFAGQAEYRVELRRRLGVAAFGGVGGVARRWGDFRSDELLPAAGAGLRFKLDKKNHINYRIDVAFGREGRTLSIGIGEAF